MIWTPRSRVTRVPLELPLKEPMPLTLMLGASSFETPLEMPRWP